MYIGSQDHAFLLHLGSLCWQPMLAQQVEQAALHSSQVRFRCMLFHFIACQPMHTWQLAEATLLCRPALHIYSWVHTALRGLVTQQKTLSASLHEFIQAYKQKNLVEVSP